MAGGSARVFKLLGAGITFQIIIAKRSCVDDSCIEVRPLVCMEISHSIVDWLAFNVGGIIIVCSCLHPYTGVGRGGGYRAKG